MKVREFISTVKNDLNSIRLDDYLSGEYIYWKGVNFVQFFINRNIQDRKLLNNSSLFHQENCIELETYKCDNCTDIPFNAKVVMRSKKKIPRIFQTNFGEILNVFNIDNSTKFNKTTLTDYTNISKKRFQSKNPYFYIENDYLLIPDKEIEKVNLRFLSFDLKTIISFSNDCQSLLDLEFPCPSFLLAEVLEKTKESLLTIKKINPDEDSNLNNNDKS
jgi:hypothetical protein